MLVAPPVGRYRLIEQTLARYTESPTNGLMRPRKTLDAAPLAKTYTAPSLHASGA